ncbi:MAG: VWA domain-containing protein [Gloeocapsa sp. DLM2.Bin57]|nr:MAG: VWA domain-containing protein [Gloeocapsa sp. DLM2.Bin57]
MTSYLRPLTRYPLFQIPCIFLLIFLLTTLLVWFLGIGRPTVAVAIALDLNPSTYPQSQFNAPGSVLNQEILAVSAYLEKNNSGILQRPNLVTIIGFASIPRQLTTGFKDDSQLLTQELNQTLANPSLIRDLGGGTDLDLAIREGIRLLNTIDDRCRELLLVTDGIASIAPETIAQARDNRIRIHAIVIGDEAEDIRMTSLLTGGVYLSVPLEADLEKLFTNRFFNEFNNNWRWVLLCLGLTWMALMWTLVMPLDRWIFQGLFKLPLNFAGRLALSNALFWTFATPGILIGIYRLLDLALPFTGSC